MERICTKCGENKPLMLFPKDKKGKDGYRAQCKVCNAARRKVHYYANREHEIERSRAYKQANVEAVRKRRAVEYVRNRAIEVERAKEWKRQNPERVRAHKYNRRKRELAVVCEWGADKERQMYEYFEYSCALTGDSENITLDHFIPLMTGKGGTTIENMIPLRSDLNFSKNDRNPFEWFTTNKARFKLSQRKFDAIVSYLAGLNDMSIREYRDYVYKCFEGKYFDNEAS